MYKILIVEDDSIIAGTLKNHLCQWGFEVRCIEDFKNVLEETADFTASDSSGYHPAVF